MAKTEIVKTESPSEVSWKSVNGQTYLFKLRKSTGEYYPASDIMTQALFAAYAEEELGGDRIVVLKAFNVRLRDANGLNVWPPEAPKKAAATPPVQPRRGKVAAATEKDIPA